MNITKRLEKFDYSWSQDAQFRGLIYHSWIVNKNILSFSDCQIFYCGNTIRKLREYDLNLEIRDVNAFLSGMVYPIFLPKIGDSLFTQSWNQFRFLGQKYSLDDKWFLFWSTRDLDSRKEMLDLILNQYPEYSKPLLVDWTVNRSLVSNFMFY